jgi:hypothetical protein
VNQRTFVITVVAVLATAGSVFIGARAIIGTTEALRSGRSAARAASRAETRQGTEIAALIADLEEPTYPDWASGGKRDPLVPYRPPAPARTTHREPPTPPPPSYQVSAVFLDADPTAVLVVGDRTVTVRVGDTVNGERVIAIDAGGVTIEGEAGARRFAYSPSN